LSLAAVFLIGFSLTGSVIGPLFGAVALLFDGLFLTLTRTATWDTPYVCFGLWALLAALSASHQKNLTLTYALYLVTAGLLGLSISCKWAGLFFFAPIAVAILLGRTPRGTLQRATAVMAIPFVALSVYLVVTCLLRRLSLLEFFDQTKHVFTFHINFIQPHRYVSPPWSWPLLVRPLWFGYQELPYLASDGSQAARGMICLGNPAVFLITGLSTFALLCILVRDAIQKLLFLPIMVPIVGYLSCWIPWMLFTNRNGFIYYFYPSLTFACIGLGVTISRLWTRGRWIATLCGFALSLIIICGALYFPVYFSIPTSQEYMETLLFRESWW
jgi:dolichyl-phosphate-mannose--protein O-mannosyl transferase